MADKDYGPRIGADPELFVQTLEGQVVPVCGKIGGTKENPLIINHLVDAQYGPEGGRRGRDPIDREGNYAIQEDNVMLEFNVPAYKESQHFQDSISKILTVIEDTVLRGQGIMCQYEVMHTFKPEDIAIYPQAFTVGCMPDMNAYADNEKFERPPFNATHFGNHRFCGGHLHIQYNHNNVPRHIFAQFMDLVAELPFLRYDKQKMRRMFYGQPGIYREKPYGIEYRTLSNFWLKKNFRDNYLGSLLDNVYYLARTANTAPEMLRTVYGKIDWGDVQQAIKTENATMADEIVEYARTKVGMYMNPPARR